MASPRSLALVHLDHCAYTRSKSRACPHLVDTLMARVAKDGFRSGFEREVAAKLDKFNLEWEFEAWECDYVRRVSRGVCMKCNASSVYSQHTYTPDFTIEGKEYVIEVKGRLTSRDRTKLIAVQATNVEVRLIFRYDNKLSPKTETRYSDWCRKEGFKFTFLNKLTKGFFK